MDKQKKQLKAGFIQAKASCADKQRSKELGLQSGGDFKTQGSR